MCIVRLLLLRSTACVVRELSGTIRCLFSVPLLLRQLILCTRLCVPDSRHGMHQGSRKSHVFTSSRTNGFVFTYLRVSRGSDCKGGVRPLGSRV